MAEPFTIYKLTILYMLDKAGFPLSNTQISNFFLEKEYTDYFRVQEVIGDLVNADLINFESTHSNTQYTLTAAGKETLGFFKDKITDGIESDVKSFFTDNKLEFRQENSILADYYRPRTSAATGRIRTRMCTHTSWICCFDRLFFSFFLQSSRSFRAYLQSQNTLRASTSRGRYH